MHDLHHGVFGAGFDNYVHVVSKANTLKSLSCSLFCALVLIVATAVNSPAMSSATAPATVPAVTAEQLFRDALTLSPAARDGLIDRLLGHQGFTDYLDPDIERAQIEEVRRRIAAVEAGESKLIPGEQVFAEIRAKLAAAGVQLP